VPEKLLEINWHSVHEEMGYCNYLLDFPTGEYIQELRTAGYNNLVHIKSRSTSEIQIYNFNL
jgi:hypothetical protein